MRNSRIFPVFRRGVFFFLVAKVATALAVYPEDDREDPDWYRCRKDSDCTVAIGICEDATPLQQKYKNLYAEWVKLKRRQGGFKCSNFLKPYQPKRPIKKCVNGYCSVTEGQKK